MKSVIEGYGNVKEELQAQLKEKEATIAKMQDEMVVQQDLLIRVQAATKRRANLMVLEADIGEEEASIVKSIARLRAAAASVQAADDWKEKWTFLSKIYILENSIVMKMVFIIIRGNFNWKTQHKPNFVLCPIWFSSLTIIEGYT